MAYDPNYTGLGALWNQTGLGNTGKATPGQISPGAYNLGGNDRRMIDQGTADFGARGGSVIGSTDGSQNQFGAMSDQDRANVLASRGGMQDYIGRLKDIAFGNAGPSAAQQQMRQGTDDSIQAQMAMAHSANPMQAGLANYTAAQQGAGMMQRNVQNTGILRAQEQAQARGEMGQALNQQRVADLQAQGLSFEQAMRQAQLEQQQTGMNDAMRLGYLNAGTAANQTAMGGQIALGNRQSQEGMAADAINSGTANANAGSSSANTAASLGALAAMMSDERNKTNIEDGTAPVRSLLGALKPRAYDYKNPEADGRGRHVGIMAQDLERSPMGREMIIETPRGKMIDMRKATGGLLAAVADLHGRLGQVEARR